MAKSFPVGFRIHIPEPVEVKMISPTLAVRNSIHPFERFKGMFTYVVEEDTFYYLSGGITDAHWKPIGKQELYAVEVLDVFANAPQKIISGFGLKAYLDQNYMTAQEIIDAIEAVKVADHVKNITQAQINKWDFLEGDKNKIHVQSSLAMTWVVNHQLKKKPALQSFLPSHKKIEGAIEHLDNDIAIIRFSNAIAGYVTAN